MKPLTDRDRRAIRLCVGGVLAVSLVRFAVMPWLEHWSGLRAAVEAAEVRADDLEHKMQRLARQRRALAADYGPAVDKPLAEVEAARVSFVKTGVELLSGAGVQVRSVQPLAPKPLAGVPGVYSVSLEVQGACQLPQLVAALAAPGKADTLIFFDRVGLSAGQGPGNLNVTLVLSTLATREDRP